MTTSQRRGHGESTSQNFTTALYYYCTLFLHQTDKVDFDVSALVAVKFVYLRHVKLELRKDLEAFHIAPCDLMRG